LYDLMYPNPVMFAERSMVDLAEEKSRFLALLKRGLYRGLPNSQLQVGRVHLNSPGPISFEGLGEPIRELRELVKDVWYRNRQERSRGDLELEILQERIRKLKAAGELPTETSSDRAEMFLASGLKVLSVLERDGKILTPPDHLGDE